MVAIMKKIIFFLSLISCTSAFAQNNKCLKKIQSVLTTPSQLYLFKNHPKIQKLFKLGCKKTDYGDSLYTTDAYVFIHEAAHFEDLKVNYNKSPKKTSESDQTENFNLYTVNNEHIGNFQSYKNLPKVKDLIRPYLKKERPDLLKEDSPFIGLHSGYIGDDQSMAADVIQGIATELNGYTHGAIIQSSVLPKVPKRILESDGKGGKIWVDNMHAKLDQTYGVMYFIYNLNLYLKLLKENHPEIWKEFYTDYNKNYLKKLLSPSIETLKSLNYCNLLKEDVGVNVWKFYVELLKGDDLKILEEVLGKPQINKLICAEDSLKMGLKFLEEKKILNLCD